MDIASAADTVDLGSITALVKPKLEKSLYLHPASRLNISNKVGSVKLSPRMVDRWANDSLSKKKSTIFSLSVYNLVNKNAVTSNLHKKFSKCVAWSVVNVNF